MAGVDRAHCQKPAAQYYVDLETLIHQVLLTVRRAQRLFTAARYGTAVGTVRRLESPVNSAEESVIYSHVS